MGQVNIILFGGPHDGQRLSIDITDQGPGAYVIHEGVTYVIMYEDGTTAPVGYVYAHHSINIDALYG